MSHSGGHVHDGGDRVEMLVNGEVVCESKAKYGGEGKIKGEWATIGEMGFCEKPVSVKKGDILNIQAHYDFDAHPARMHAHGGQAEQMGLANFSLAKKKGA